MNTRRLPAGEEPELNNERDIPTEDAADDPSPATGRRGREADVERGPAAGEPAVAGRESVAGEEDPGAALDTGADAAEAPDAGR